MRIQISESAARTRNGMERMTWPISWSTTQALEAESGADDHYLASRNPDNFAQHFGVQAPTDSTKHSKQKELTEKTAGD